MDYIKKNWGPKPFCFSKMLTHPSPIDVFRGPKR